MDNRHADVSLHRFPGGAESFSFTEARRAGILDFAWLGNGLRVMVAFRPHTSPAQAGTESCFTRLLNSWRSLIGSSDFRHFRKGGGFPLVVEGVDIRERRDSAGGIDSNVGSCV
jgi:hypothetical protein